MDERRKSQRVQISDYLANNRITPKGCFRVFHGKSDQFIGHLADISVAGLMIRSDQPIKQDTMLEMKVELPQNITEGDKLIVKGKCLWWHQAGKQNLCEIGFKIENSSSDLTHIILQLIKDSDTVRSTRGIPTGTA